MVSVPGVKFCKAKSYGIKTSHHTNFHQKLGSPLFCSWKNRHFMGLCKSLQNFLKKNLINWIIPFCQAPCSHSGSGKTVSLDGPCGLRIAAVNCLCHPWVWSICFWSDSVAINTFVQIVECMELCLGAGDDLVTCQSCFSRYVLQTTCSRRGK